VPELSSPLPPADRFESSLPHLPVPTLEETAARYLASIKPYHVSTVPGSPATPLPSWEKSEKAVKEFVEDPLVKSLQERLLKRAEEKESWLSDWWNETAYTGWRGPVAPWFAFLPFLPPSSLKGTDEEKRTG
jgi:carnitine O-acetyltransferase